ncbi:MAG: hypothetical protein ACON4T_05495 [Synechococcus sp.]
MLFHGAHYSSGVLGFVCANSKTRDLDIVFSICSDSKADVFLVDYTARKGSKTVHGTIPVRGNFEVLNDGTWLDLIGKEQVQGRFTLNGKTHKLTVYPCPSHPGNVIIQGFDDLSVTAVRHDCNPWPVAAVVAVTVSVSVAVVAPSAAVITLAVTGTELKVEADTSGVSVELKPGGGGDDDENGEEGGE